MSPKPLDGPVVKQLVAAVIPNIARRDKKNFNDMKRTLGILSSFGATWK